MGEVDSGGNWRHVNHSGFEGIDDRHVVQVGTHD